MARKMKWICLFEGNEKQICIFSVGIKVGQRAKGILSWMPISCFISVTGRLPYKVYSVITYLFNANLLDHFTEDGIETQYSETDIISISNLRHTPQRSYWSGRTLYLIQKITLLRLRLYGYIYPPKKSNVGYIRYRVTSHLLCKLTKCWIIPKRNCLPELHPMWQE